MGNNLSYLKEIFGLKNFKVLMVGLHSVGKTTILYRLKLNEFIQTIPNVGYNVETIQFDGNDFTIWDVSSNNKIEPLWKHYLEGTNIIIYVIDLTDHERFEEAKNELYQIISNENLKNILLLIYLNKQDLTNIMNIEEIKNNLNLNSFLNIRWHIQSCSAIEGIGLNEGLEWIKNNL